jgi:hypothetical protein
MCGGHIRHGLPILEARVPSSEATTEVATTTASAVTAVWEVTAVPARAAFTGFDSLKLAFIALPWPSAGDFAQFT